MIIRQILGAAALLMMAGAAPPVAEAAVQRGPYRFTVVTPDDNPAYIQVRHGRRHYRKVRLGPGKKMVWRYV